MSKTFESVVGEDVEVLVRGGGGVFIAIRRGGETRQATTLDSADAPALALAILEAAGYEERQKGWDVLNSADENFAQAMRCLSKGVELQERITAEAEAQAELEAEALELFNASRLERGLDELDWVRVIPSERAEWLAVARKAREINKEATK